MSAIPQAQNLASALVQSAQVQRLVADGQI